MTDQQTNPTARKRRPWLPATLLGILLAVSAVATWALVGTHEYHLTNANAQAKIDQKLPMTVHAKLPKLAARFKSINPDINITSTRIVFKPGNRLGGRPLGSRNRLSEIALQALGEDIAEHGAETIERVRREKPHVYRTTRQRRFIRPASLAGLSFLLERRGMAAKI